MTNKKLKNAKRMLSNLSKSSLSRNEEKIIEELEDFGEPFDGRETTINDYIEKCGYTRKEAIAAYENLKKFE
tara:strand:- start:5997 stop:6212 length:216 start_codon:yes stop_codon:yes gene_type:complete